MSCCWCCCSPGHQSHRVSHESVPTDSSRDETQFLAPRRPGSPPGRRLADEPGSGVWGGQVSGYPSRLTPGWPPGSSPTHRPRLRLPRATRPFLMCKEFPCRQRCCSWNISQMDRLQELCPRLLLQTWACIPPHPLPWLHFLWREDKGLLAPGGLGTRLAGRRGGARPWGSSLFSSSLWGASKPGGA